MIAEVAFIAAGVLALAGNVALLAIAMRTAPTDPEEINHPEAYAVIETDKDGRIMGYRIEGNGDGY